MTTILFYRPTYTYPHLHGQFNFTGSRLETARQSLHHSCATSIKCQWILLP